MKDLNFIIAKNITELRKKNGLTQAELAEKLNMSEEELSRLYRRADELSALSDSDNMYGHRW